MTRVLEQAVRVHEVTKLGQAVAMKSAGPAMDPHSPFRSLLKLRQGGVMIGPHPNWLFLIGFRVLLPKPPAV
jgi:hypothetical protein